MGSKLSFGSKFIEDTIICDYCRYHKCNWIDANPNKAPQFCPKPKMFKLADGEIPKMEFQARVGIAKKIGIYLPNERIWQFSIKKAGKVTGIELANVIDTINSWSQKNDFSLIEMIRYQKKEDVQKPIDKY